MEVRIIQYNKNIDKNREYGLYPIANEDFVTVHLNEDSTLKDLRGKLSEKLQINNESLKLRGVEGRLVRHLGIEANSTSEDNIFLFRTMATSGTTRQEWGRPSAARAPTWALSAATFVDEGQIGLGSVVNGGYIYSGALYNRSSNNPFTFEIIHGPALRDYDDLLKAKKRMKLGDLI